MMKLRGSINKQLLMQLNFYYMMDKLMLLVLLLQVQQMGLLQLLFILVLVL